MPSSYTAKSPSELIYYEQILFIFSEIVEIDNRWVTGITKFITKDVFFILINMPELFEIL